MPAINLLGIQRGATGEENPMKHLGQATAVLTALCAAALGGCSGDDPGNQDSSAGNGGRAGRDARDGGTAGRAGDGAAGDDGGAAGSAADAGEPPAGDGSYFPLVPGNRWTFRVTDGAAISMKGQVIGDLEPVGGTGPNASVMAYRATTTKADGTDMTVSWQAEVDDKIVRYREQSFMGAGSVLNLEEHWDPYKLRVDMTEQHLVAGATWAETCMETKLPVGMAPSTTTVTDTWRVVAVDEPVTVPAGTFDALVLEKTGASALKRYWFVRGVGKVKETGTQTEELADYDVVE
jgi:hypothetical protein